eukprot:TRINITY_DN64642_c0_g1_i2.p1 TRINITY_DN64642_c0_g1~~TRINITY_DN64642_c0_g1_i2.p1  ORF type:complete len:145 (+),score=5.69 TRINITY_DN64642_c0_g1_i2:128-562(+)
MSLFDDIFTDTFSHPAFHIVPYNDNNGNNKLVTKKAFQNQMNIDFIENKDNYELHADLPGYSKDNIDVHVDNGVLTLEATRDETKTEEDGKYYHKERSYGKVFRSFRLPVDANKETPELKYVDGVLNITFPKVENAGAKKLTIS